MYDEKDLCTNTTGRAAKVLKNKAKTIHSLAEIGDCHEPKEVVVCFMFCVAGFFLFFFVSEKYMFK